MSKHASSSHSQSKTSNNVIATSKKLSSSSAERDQDAWAKSNAKELLRVFMDWKGAGTAPSDCPATHTCYHATEGTDKDLYYNLVSEKIGTGKMVALTVSQGSHLQEIWPFTYAP